MPWNYKVFVVGSLEEAIRIDAIASRSPEILRDPEGIENPDWEHLTGDALIEAGEQRIAATQAAGIETPPNPLMHGLYVIVPGADLKTMPAEELNYLKRRIPRRAVYEIGDDGIPVMLDPNMVRELIDPSAMVRAQYFKFEPTHLRMDGWCFPKQRGVLIFDEVTDAKSSTYKKMGSEARRIHKKMPIEVRFNAAFESALNRVQIQDRLGQTRQNNRMNDQVRDALLKMQDEGKAFSFETWRKTNGPNSEWTLGGGTYGTFKDGKLSLDSIYYDHNLDNAKLAFLMLRERMQAAGMKYIDLGMISPFSRKSLRGRYIPAEEFLKLFEAVDPDAKPDFSTPWHP